MQIKRLVIENFKSIERIELIEPNPFTVFVGPNGSGKSNIFEALEFNRRFSLGNQSEAVRFHGGREKMHRRNSFETDWIRIDYLFQNSPYHIHATTTVDFHSAGWGGTQGGVHVAPTRDNINGFEAVNEGSRIPETIYSQYFVNFSRLFVKNIGLLRAAFQDDEALNLAATNLEQVLSRVLKNPVLREEIFEWLSLFVPGFKAVEVDDRDELHWFEESSERYFTKDLISDGTYSILAMLTAVYQSDDEPQFLCIEEPENGLHPQVAREMVDFFRTMCEERGHYIWLNTHSPYMVSRVRPEELVVVDKVNGATQVKQFKGREFDGMRMDEAWLTNVLNGGKAW